VASIVITYRRDDSEGWVGRLYDHLVRHFGEDQVFRDLDTLKPGDTWREVIENAIAAADVILVVIGPHWLTVTDVDGRSRLAADDDSHRQEVATALRVKDKRVIPVLVQGAAMPRAIDLPPDLVELTHRQNYSLSDGPRWISDVKALVDVLARYVEPLDRGDADEDSADGADPFLRKSFLASDVNIEHLAEQLAAWLEARDFDVQMLPAIDDGWVVQARHTGSVRSALGVGSALTVALRRHNNDVLRVNIQSGRWLDRANGTGRNVLSSLASLPFVGQAGGWAAWQRDQLPSRILTEIRRYLESPHQSAPGVPLLERMRQEVAHLEQTIGSSVKLNRDADGFIVSLRYTSTRGHLVELFLACPPDYPTQPPNVVLAIDNQQRRFSSPTLRNWRSDKSLATVAQEVLSSS